MNAQARLRCYRFAVRSLPIITVLISVLTTIGAYVVAVYKDEKLQNQEVKFIPFISDLGDDRPESSVFTFGMTLSGCVTFAIIFVRYLQVRNFCITRDCYNHASLITGAIFVAGKFMVVSFQLSSQIAVHYMAATFYFLGTFVYAVLQALISRSNGSRHVYRLRVVVCVGMFSSGFLFGLFLLQPMKRSYRGYQLSEIAEWIFVILKMIFMLTFLSDFKNVLPVFQMRHYNPVNYESFDEAEYFEIPCDGFEGIETRV